MRSTYRKSLAVTAVASLAMFSAACGSDDDTDTAAAGGGGDATDTPTESSEPSDEMDPMANLVGAGCATYAKAVPDGAGSVEGMSQDPVATAASNNPLLTTLVATVSGQFNPKVNLVDTLNGDEFTVFAPVDDAFGKLPASALKDLAKPKNADTLSTILTYHVIPGQLSPDQVVGTQTSVQGEDVKVTGSGDNLKVDDASVICGGVVTANATVYLIDSVLMPPSMV
ncbi:hypothetical protein BH18ACT8_BH18ACT8_09520 [soil metagenome]